MHAYWLLLIGLLLVLMAFVGAAINANDPSAYEIYFGVQAPAPAGTGVFLNPLGVVNAASSAPAGNPISPGEFVTLYGTGLAKSNQTATPPYPLTLNGGRQTARFSLTLGGAAGNADSGGPNSWLPRVFTSTKASLRPSQATRSISPLPESVR